MKISNESHEDTPLKMLVLGRNGTGKSALLGRLPNPIIILGEGHGRRIIKNDPSKKLQIVEPESAKDLYMLFTAIRTMRPAPTEGEWIMTIGGVDTKPFASIGVDGFNSLFGSYSRVISATAKNTKSAILATADENSIIEVKKEEYAVRSAKDEQLGEWLTILNRCPAPVVVTAGIVVAEKRKETVTLENYKIAIDSQLSANIGSFFAIVGVSDKKIEADTETMEIVDGQIKSQMITNYILTFQGPDPTKKTPEWPSVFINKLDSDFFTNLVLSYPKPGAITKLIEERKSKAKAAKATKPTAAE